MSPRVRQEVEEINLRASSMRARSRLPPCRSCLSSSNQSASKSKDADHGAWNIGHVHFNLEASDRNKVAP